MNSAQLGKYLEKEERRLGRPLSAWELVQLGRSLEKRVRIPTNKHWREARLLLDRVQSCYPQVTDEPKYPPGTQGRLVQEIRLFLHETDRPHERRKRRDGQVETSADTETEDASLS